MISTAKKVVLMVLEYLLLGIAITSHQHDVEPLTGKPSKQIAYL
jgi:hypothetical protein